MKKQWMILFVCLLNIIYACNGERETEALFRVDLKVAEREMQISEFIREITFIPLSAENGGLMGVATGLHITNDRIFALDAYKTRSLYSFDLKGSFIERIGRIGNGPGEYRFLTDFLVDTVKQQIMLLADGNKIITTDFMGNCIQEQRIEQLRSNHLFLLGGSDSTYVFINNVGSGKDYLVYFTDSKFKSFQEFCPIPEGYENIALYGLTYTGYDDKWLYAPPLSPVIYGIDEHGCEKRYEFFMDPQFKLTKEKLKKFRRMNPREVIARTENFFYLIGFYEFKEQLFVTFLMGGNIYWGIYDHKSAEFKYVDCRNIKHADSFDVSSFYFLTQVDRETIAGVVVPQKYDSAGNETKEITDENANPIVVICKMAGN